MSQSNDPPEGLLLDFMSCKEHPGGHFIVFCPLKGHPRGESSGTGASSHALPQTKQCFVAIQCNFLQNSVPGKP